MDSASISGDWVGRVIDGKFPLRQWLGSSGWGGVFLTELGGEPARKAAIKLIPADDRAAQARIRNWAAAANLSHPHLMRIFHTGSCRIDGGLLLYAVTEYAEENLSQILPERPLTATETREMLAPLVDALGYLHQNGFVHGHLKPSNMLVVDDQLKVSSESLRRAGEPAGVSSPAGVCDAPESAAGPLSPAADVWSLGVLLVETLTQHPPVWERSTQQQPVVPASTPEPFAAIARECLQTAPERRCTLPEIRIRLQNPPSLLKPANLRPARKSSAAAPAKRRSAPLVAAVLVLVVVIFALLLRSHQSPPPTAEPEAAAPAAESSRPSPIVRLQSQAGTPVDSAIANQVLPDVPPVAKNTIRGTIRVNIRVTVDPSGTVSDAAIDSAGSKYFANLALQAARKWRFKPAPANVSRVRILRFEFTQATTRAAIVDVTQ